jgi:serine/threonine-protein kinase MRCK
VQTNFYIPDDVEVSNDAKDLLKKLICSAENRIGKSGIDEIKNHPFFAGIDWDNMRKLPPPYLPELSGDSDTSNFDEFEPVKPGRDPAPSAGSNVIVAHLPFIGFTYTHSSLISDKPLLEDVDGPKGKSARAAGMATENKRLREKVNSLEKQIQELKQETLVRKHAARRTSLMEDGDDRCSQLEKDLKALKREKMKLDDELESVRGKLTSKEKDFRDLKSATRELRYENEQLVNKFQDLRTQKSKLAQLVKEREEEIDQMQSKLDRTKRDLRDAEHQRRSLSTELEEMKGELTVELKMRKKSEESSKALEQQLHGIQRGVQSDRGRSSQTQTLQKEIDRLEKKVKDLETDQQETLSKMKAQHKNDVSSLQASLDKSEVHNSDLMKECDSLKKKIEDVRRTSMLELDASLNEKNTRFLKEKQTLQAENKKLQDEIEKMTLELSDASHSKVENESELKELRKYKDQLTSWENQIATVIQWMTEEKDARNYLETMASKLTSDVDRIKSQYHRMHLQKEEWKTLRSQKKEKQDLLDLQLSLQTEVNAKKDIQEKLTKMTKEFTETEKKLQETEKAKAQLLVQFNTIQQELVQAKAAVRRAESRSSIIASQQHQVQVSQPSSHGVGGGTTSHEMVIRSFEVPTKCDHCTSFMQGQVRQGMTCKVCHFSCHVGCAEQAVQICPLPPGQVRTPMGIDIHHGVGTACEGWIKIPKPGGVRKGWQRQYAIICDFKIFFHDVVDNKVSPSATLVFDMRDENFAVSTVTREDVIHASSRLIPFIFKVSCSSNKCPSVVMELLILTENNETERDKWFAVIEELLKAIKSKDMTMPSIVSPVEMYDNTQIDVLKTTAAAAILDSERVLLGSEDGLFLLEIADDGAHRLGDKKVVQIEVVQEEDTVIYLGGKHRMPSLVCMSQLGSSDLESSVIRINDAKYAQFMACGTVASSRCVCIALKRKVIVYEITKLMARYTRLKEFEVKFQVQCMSIKSGRLLLGSLSQFYLYNLTTFDQTPTKLINAEDLSLGFIRLNELDAINCVELSATKEYLLCFHYLAVYVNGEGKRSRKEELLWHSTPLAIAYKSPHLIVYCDSGVEIYDADQAKWIQTIPIRKLHSISENGSLVMTSDSPRLLYMKHIYDEFELTLPDLSKRKRNTRRHSSQRGKSSRPLISAPMDFSHVSHIGPGELMSSVSQDGGLESKFSVPGRPISGSMSAYTLRDTPDDPSPVVAKRKNLLRIQSAERVSAEINPDSFPKSDSNTPDGDSS